jgi:hypothetical protein
MTGIRDASDPIARWRATIEALEAVVRAAPDEPEIDTAEAKEVRRLITMRLAAARPNNLPAAWVRRPGILPQIVPDTVARPETTETIDLTDRRGRAGSDLGSSAIPGRRI